MLQLQLNLQLSHWVKGHQCGQNKSSTIESDHFLCHSYHLSSLGCIRRDPKIGSVLSLVLCLSFILIPFLNIFGTLGH